MKISKCHKSSKVHGTIMMEKKKKRVHGTALQRKENKHVQL